MSKQIRLDYIVIGKALAASKKISAKLEEFLTLIDNVDKCWDEVLDAQSLMFSLLEDRLEEPVKSRVPRPRTQVDVSTGEVATPDAEVLSTKKQGSEVSSSKGPWNPFAGAYGNSEEPGNEPYTSAELVDGQSLTVSRLSKSQRIKLPQMEYRAENKHKTKKASAKKTKPKVEILSDKQSAPKRLNVRKIAKLFGAKKVITDRTINKLLATKGLQERDEAQAPTTLWCPVVKVLEKARKFHGCADPLYHVDGKTIYWDVAFVTRIIAGELDIKLPVSL